MCSSDLWFRPPRRPEPLPPPSAKPPRRSRRLGGEAAGPEKTNGRCRPDSSFDYVRCCTSMVTKRMKVKGFINANKTQFACTLETKQPPRSARLSRKKKEYKATLVSTKMREANEKLGAMDWEVLDANALMNDNHQVCPLCCC